MFTWKCWSEASLAPSGEIYAGECAAHGVWRALFLRFLILHLFPQVRAPDWYAMAVVGHRSFIFVCPYCYEPGKPSRNRPRDDRSACGVMLTPCRHVPCRVVIVDRKQRTDLPEGPNHGEASRSRSGRGEGVREDPCVRGRDHDGGQTRRAVATAGTGEPGVGAHLGTDRQGRRPRTQRRRWYHPGRHGL